MFVTDFMHVHISRRPLCSFSFHLFFTRLRTGEAKNQIQQNTTQQIST